MDLRRTHERRAVHTEARSRPFQRTWHASSGEPVFESTEPRAAPRPEPPALGKCVSSSSGSRLPLHASAPYTSAHGAPQRPERTSADTRVSRQTRPARSQDTRSVHALVLIGRRSSAPPRALARRGVSRGPRHVTRHTSTRPTRKEPARSADSALGSHTVLLFLLVGIRLTRPTAPLGHTLAPLAGVGSTPYVTRPRAPSGRASLLTHSRRVRAHRAQKHTTPVRTANAKKAVTSPPLPRLQRLPPPARAQIKGSHLAAHISPAPAPCCVGRNAPLRHKSAPTLPVCLRPAPRHNATARDSCHSTRLQTTLPPRACATVAEHVHTVLSCGDARKWRPRDHPFTRRLRGLDNAEC